MRNSVLYRAIVVTLILMSLSFVGTAYYHYKTNAATDYLSMDNGSFWSNPMSSEERYAMYEPGGRKYTSIYLERLLIDGASIHISKSYLENKYPNIFPDVLFSANEQRLKQERKDYHSEVTSIIVYINKYYESSYKEEALTFACKWTVLLPLSLITLLCIVLGTKNYILHGHIKTAH